MAPNQHLHRTRFLYAPVVSCILTSLFFSRQAKYSDIRNIPQRTASNDMPAQPAPVKKESESQTSLNVAAPSADKTSAAASKSTIDVNANPIHAGTGKPITQVNIDEGQ